MTAHEQPGGTAWEIRPYREGDIPAIVAMINAADEVDKLGKGASEGEFRSRIENPSSKPEEQIFLVVGPRPEGLPEGMPLGYGWLNIFNDLAASERAYNPRFTVHPAARGLELERFIVGRLVWMAREREALPGTQPMRHVEIDAFTRQSDRVRRQVWADVGLKEARQFWTMERDLREPIDEPRQIEGVRIRPYRLPEDNNRARTAYNSSFADHYDFHPDTEEDWNHGISTPAARTDLSWLAEVEADPETIAGFCICWVFAESNARTGKAEGWIDILGTIREWRDKGLGKSLLLQGMSSLRDAGLDTALLHVDSASPTGANKLYESVGFRVRYHDVNMKAPLAEVKL